MHHGPYSQVHIQAFLVDIQNALYDCFNSYSKKRTCYEKHLCVMARTYLDTELKQWIANHECFKYETSFVASGLPLPCIALWNFLHFYFWMFYCALFRFSEGADVPCGGRD
jgi:hypothetical protein